MSNTAVHAKKSLVFMDGHDYRRLLTSARMPMSRQDVDVTTFGVDDMEAIVGMRNGAFNIEGFAKGNSGAYTASIGDAIGTTETNHVLTWGPQGEGVGKEAYLIDSHQNSFEIGAPFSGAVMISAVFQATGGPRRGIILHQATGNTGVTVDTIQVIEFDHVAADHPLTMSDGTTTVAITATMTNGQFKTAAEAIWGGTITPSGSRTTSVDADTGETLYTGSVVLTFGGSLAGTLIPPMAVMGGEQHRISVVGGSAGSYTYSGGSFLLSDTVAAVQTAVRATGGAKSNAVIKGNMTAPAPTSYLVDFTTTAGSGDTFEDGNAMTFRLFSGLYEAAGTLNGKPRAFDGYNYIYWSSANNFWAMNKSGTDDGGASVRNPSNSATIPLTGWNQSGGALVSGSVTAVTSLTESVSWSHDNAQKLNVNDWQTNHWQPTNGQYGSLDLGALKVVSNLIVQPSDGMNPNGTDFLRIQGSANSDMSSPVTLYQKTSSEIAATGYTRHPEASLSSTPVRYIRATWDSSSTGNQAHFEEIKLAGPAVGAGAAELNVYYPVSVGNIANQSVTGTGITTTGLQNGAVQPTSVVVEMQQSGGVSEGYYLESTSGSAAVIDNGAATAHGFTAHFHLTYLSGTSPSIQVIIEHSTNGSTGWTAVATFTTKTAIGVQRMTGADGVTVNRYVRVRWVIAGTAPSAAFAVAFSRYGTMIY